MIRLHKIHNFFNQHRFSLCRSVGGDTRACHLCSKHNNRCNLSLRRRFICSSSLNASWKCFFEASYQKWLAHPPTSVEWELNKCSTGQLQYRISSSLPQTRIFLWEEFEIIKNQKPEICLDKFFRYLMVIVLSGIQFGQ